MKSRVSRNLGLIVGHPMAIGLVLVLALVVPAMVFRASAPWLILLPPVVTFFLTIVSQLSCGTGEKAPVAAVARSVAQPARTAGGSQAILRARHCEKSETILIKPVGGQTARPRPLRSKARGSVSKEAARYYRVTHGRAGLAA